MQPRYDCNCDAVIGMEDLGVGTAEILQYASAVLSRKRCRDLISGLEAILGESEDEGDDAVADGRENPAALSEVAS